MSQVLQVLEIFKIWITRFSNFAGRQKGPALAASDRQSMMVMAAICVEIIDNFYFIVHDRRRLDVC